MAARIAMMAITTRSSISVKACRDMVCFSFFTAPNAQKKITDLVSPQTPAENGSQTNKNHPPAWRWSTETGGVLPADAHYEITVQVYPSVKPVSMGYHNAISKRGASSGAALQAALSVFSARSASGERQTALRAVRKTIDSSGAR